jgi:pre-60S factor REI1
MLNRYSVPLSIPIEVPSPIQGHSLLSYNFEAKSHSQGSPNRRKDNPMASCTKFPCNTCSIKFITSAEQRSHMQSNWHVSNLHRRIAGQPALSENEYTEAIPKPLKPLHRSPSIELEADTVNTEEREKHEEIPPATQCLFCPTSSPSIGENIEHMASIHGLFIPQANHIIDMHSCLGYLGTIVFEQHQCLYCGRTKGSLEAVRTHMKDKGHRKLRTGDVSAFLDEEVESLPEFNKGKGWKLPSGVVITSKSNTTRHASLRRAKEGKTISSGTDTQVGSMNVTKQDVQLTTHNAHLCLSGVPISTIRTLKRGEKRNRTIQAVVEKTFRKKMEQAPLLTKYYKMENPVYQAG